MNNFPSRPPPRPPRPKESLYDTNLVQSQSHLAIKYSKKSSNFPQTSLTPSYNNGTNAIESSSSSPYWPLPNGSSFYEQKHATSSFTNITQESMAKPTFYSPYDHTYRSNHDLNTARSSQASEISILSLSDYLDSEENYTTPTLKRSDIAQYTNVSPIMEESENRFSLRSFASSMAIPNNDRLFGVDESETTAADINKKEGKQLHQPGSIGKTSRQSISSINSIRMNGSQKLQTHQPTISYESINSLRAAAGADIDKYLADLEKDQESMTFKKVKRGTLAERISPMIPTRLTARVVKEENRMSTTSLPDLIRRATALAANLDRGKTASRFGSDWMAAKENHNEEGRQTNDFNYKHFSSPQSDTTITNSSPAKGSSNGKPTQRICGVGQKMFIILIIIFIVLILAAVTVPVALAVIANSRKTQASQNGSTKYAACSNTLPCMNGGLSMTVESSSSTCICLCTSGFNGATCQFTPDQNCTTVDIPGAKNITLGREVLPTLNLAKSNFSIPLDESFILSVFAKYNSTCVTENALLDISEITPSDQVKISGPNVTNNLSTMDFVKVAILFVLQDSQNLTMASFVRTKVITFWTSANKIQTNETKSSTQKVDVGNGYTFDFWQKRITTRNGTVYGNDLNSQ